MEKWHTTDTWWLLPPPGRCSRMPPNGRSWQVLTWSWACTTGHPASDQVLEAAANAAWPYAACSERSCPVQSWGCPLGGDNFDFRLRYARLFACWQTDNYLRSAYLLAIAMCYVGIALGRVPDSKLRIHAQRAFITASMSWNAQLGGAGTKFVQRQDHCFVSC